MNQMDAALQLNTPVIAVPRFERLEPLSKNGHRFLVAQDGLWIEARRSWCHVVLPLGIASNSVIIPFGKLEKKVELAFGKFPQVLLDKFVAQAVAAHPIETGAVCVFNADTNSLRFVQCESVSAGIGYLKARWPVLSPNETVAIDMHSHGPIGAYFSETDRRDMGSDVVLACVVGKTNKEIPEIVISLFCCGKEIRVNLPTPILIQDEVESEIENIEYMA